MNFTWLYLANGSAEGLVIAELANWNGKAIKINRADVATCEREDGVEGFATNAGFLVLKGSRTSARTVASFVRHGGAYCKLRGELEANGTIKKHVFTRDYEFKSPSAASSVLCGRMSNGLADWKDADGRALRERLG